MTMMMADGITNESLIIANVPVVMSAVSSDNCSHIGNDSSLVMVEQLTHGTIIPVLSAVGIVLNVLNLIVLGSGKLTESSYTYLTGLAFADLCTLTLFMFNGIGRGHYPSNPNWRAFEAYVYFPCGFITSAAGVLLTVTVSVERNVFIYRPLQARTLCTKDTARKTTAILWAACVALNLLRFFVFQVDYDAGKLDYTEFGKSRAYEYLSWFYLLFMSCGSGLALIILNMMLIVGIRLTNNKRQQSCGGANQQRKSMLHQRRKQDEVRLTWTLVSIVFVFLLGEIPSALTSRALVVGISRNPCIVKTKGFKIASIVATLLVVLQLSFNFVVYCVFNPRFWAVFKQQICQKVPEKYNVVKKTYVKNGGVEMQSYRNTASIDAMLDTQDPE